MIRSSNQRRGAIAFVTVIAAFFLATMMVVLITNAGLVHRKLTGKAAADDAVQAAGTVAARAMNTLCANQHIMGEMLAIQVLCYSYGGIELEEGKGIPLKLKPAVDAAYAAAVAASIKFGYPPPNEMAYKAVSVPHSDCGGAIGDGREDLQRELIDALKEHAAGGYAKSLPMQAKILTEWLLLEKLEIKAKTELLPLKQAFNQAVNKLYGHNKALVTETPEKMLKAATEAGGVKDARIAAAMPFKLPVVEEKALVKQHGWERSQAVRAITPWVQYWRKPVLDYGDRYLKLANFSKHYIKWTQEYTWLMPHWQAGDWDNYFFVLEDCNYDKGTERWTTEAGSKRADDLFGIAVKADFKDRSAFAQEMLYNGNPQEPDQPANKKWQRRVGWDTLQWDPDCKVPEYKTGDKANERIEQPRIKINWRTKLTPATLAAEAAGTPGEPIWLQIAQ